MKKYILTLLAAVFMAAAPMLHAADSERIDKVWKGGKKELTFGYNTGSFDLGMQGGKLDSRWGASLTTMRNIYLHRGPIAGMLKFGLHLGFQIDYLNFAKGSGSLKDLTSGDFEGDMPQLGKHYLDAGIGVGPTLTIAPFINSGSLNLARLKFRLFFHVVPSYAGYITSGEDETDIHSAFVCFYSGGLNVMWRKLNLGVEWKGGRGKYKGLTQELMGDEGFDLFYNPGNPRYGTKMFSAKIGFVF